MKVALMWFRRDLRLVDNTALYHALKGPYPVVPIFVFDTHILDQLEERADRRISFICAALAQMHQELAVHGSGMELRHGTPVESFSYWLTQYEVMAVYANHDYEPYARTRDAAIADMLQARGIAFHTYKDQVIFEKDEVIKEEGRPYSVFTPYARKWKERLAVNGIQQFPSEELLNGFARIHTPGPPTPEQLGFLSVQEAFPASHIPDEVIRQYDAQRDYPAQVGGTSRLGVHLRFGTVSIRRLVAKALALNATYLNELIWREFYQAILWHFPHVGRGRAFKPAYEGIAWRNSEEEFDLWCEGKTGYPMVDAGMRELNTTGYMHNRVRMITASFLCKHLLIDWRWGEAYFAQKLLDYDLAANNGGWQWASGSGCDAAPYFRVFNPTLQKQKFDPLEEYVRRWVPELATGKYPQPMVNHEFARQRALETYKRGLENQPGVVQ